MTENMSPMYEQVCSHARQMALIASIESLLGWDERTYLPPAGGEYRAEQSTFIAGLVHQRWVDKSFGDHLEALAAGPLAADPTSDTAVVIRRLKRTRNKKIKLPQSLVEELTRTAVLGQQAWQEARQRNDFALFRPLLEKTIFLKKQQAEALGYEEHPYDALLDDYEPEARTADIARVLAGLREQLVPMVTTILLSGRLPRTDVLQRDFPLETQKTFGRRIAEAIGFDFTRGRIDVTAHPFCAGIGPHDCRITTRYDENSFNMALFGILHEAGHGLYEQGLPAQHYGLPLGEAISLGIHESQSRLWENFVGRSRAFWNFFYPQAQELFPLALGHVTLNDFYFAINEVRPSLIRVEADELTYNLHILIRFELELALLEGDLQAADLPAPGTKSIKNIWESPRPAMPRACCRTFTGAREGSAIFPPMRWAISMPPNSLTKPERNWAIWTPCSSAAILSRFAIGSGRRSIVKGIAIRPPNWWKPLPAGRSHTNRSWIICRKNSIHCTA